MELSEKIIQTYTEILREELVPAMGCTEPIAIAYAASILREALGICPDVVRVGLSGNIIKNVKSVIVPATGGMHGISAAVAAGIIAARPDKKLEVLSELDASSQAQIIEYLQTADIKLNELDTPNPFELRMIGEANGHTATVHLAHRHTNVQSVTVDGKDLTDRYRVTEASEDASSADRQLLNVETIVAFADTVAAMSVAIFLYEPARSSYLVLTVGTTARQNCDGLNGDGSDTRTAPLPPPRISAK